MMGRLEEKYVENQINKISASITNNRNNNNNRLDVILNVDTSTEAPHDEVRDLVDRYLTKYIGLGIYCCDYVGQFSASTINGMFLFNQYRVYKRS